MNYETRCTSDICKMCGGPRSPAGSAARAEAWVAHILAMSVLEAHRKNVDVALKTIQQARAMLSNGNVEVAHALTAVENALLKPQAPIECPDSPVRRVLADALTTVCSGMIAHALELCKVERNRQSAYMESERSYSRGDVLAYVVRIEQALGAGL